jgi:hypothetical protein
MPPRRLGAVAAPAGDTQPDGAPARRSLVLREIAALFSRKLDRSPRGRSPLWPVNAGRIGGTASTSASDRRLSVMFAAVSRRANGMARRR